MSKSKAKPKKEITYSQVDMERYLGALTEHFDDGIKAVGEKVDFLHEKMDRRFEQVDKRFEQVDKRFEQVDKRFEQVDKRFEQVDKRFEKIEKTQDTHTEMIGRIMIQLEEIKGELKQKVDYRDFAKLEKRVTRLEVAGAGK